MKALLLDAHQRSVTHSLQRIELGRRDSLNEQWLQTVLFEHPDAVPLDVVDPGAGLMVPICRELPLPKENATVFLDLLAVTAQGRLVLIECKLWRNPQARREVIAQILEYAALLQRWTYADLTARLKAFLRWSGANPLVDHVRQRVPNLDQTRFVDCVSRCLRIGDFDLIVAGDGIRSDLQAIANHLNLHSGLTARLALVEFQLWADEQGRTVVVPAIPLRTEVLQQRVIVNGDGHPLRLERMTDVADEVEEIVDPDRANQRSRNRTFWQRFIDECRFDHPDQPPPRHGGNNWVRMELPPPAGGMTAYRIMNDRVGVFFTLKGEAGAAAFHSFEDETDALRSEINPGIGFERQREQPFEGQIFTNVPLSELGQSDDALLAWLQDASKRMVNAFRPRLAALSRGR